MLLNILIHPYLNIFPGRSLPARPALWIADALDIGTVINESAPSL